MLLNLCARGLVNFLYMQQFYMLLHSSLSQISEVVLCLSIVFIEDLA